MTNGDRRKHARRALRSYKKVPGLDTGEDYTTLTDLMADLAHLADTLRRDGKPATGDSAFATAQSHYHAERGATGHV